MAYAAVPGPKDTDYYLGHMDHWHCLPVAGYRHRVHFLEVLDIASGGDLADLFELSESVSPRGCSSSRSSDLLVAGVASGRAATLLLLLLRPRLALLEDGSR